MFLFVRVISNIRNLFRRHLAAALGKHLQKDVVPLARFWFSSLHHSALTVF
jgi:hypothetical protein